MGYQATCDVCPNVAPVGPDGDLPEGWGTMMVEFFPEADRFDPEGADPETKKGNCVKILTCGTCSEEVAARGMSGIGEQLKDAFRDIMKPVEAGAPEA